MCCYTRSEAFRGAGRIEEASGDAIIMSLLNWVLGKGIQQVSATLKTCAGLGN